MTARHIGGPKDGSTVAARRPGTGGDTSMARRELSRRTFMAGLASTGAAVLVAACGAPPAAPSKPAEPAAAAQPTAAAAKPAAPAAQGKTTVRFHERANNVVEGGAQFELFKPGGHLDKWRDAHPNVEVVVEPLPPATPEYGPK